MSDIIGRLLDEAEKAQRKGHLVLAEVCRDASDQLGLVMEERDRMKDALKKIGGITMSMCLNYKGMAETQRGIALAALKETGHE
jgi:hypothetical protein